MKTTTIKPSVDNVSTSKRSIRELLQKWDALNANQLKMEAHILDLIAHPDATAQDILKVAQKLRDSRDRLREGYGHLREALPVMARKQGVTGMLNYLRPLQVPHFMKKNPR
jgi:hypothetical protein